jgi:hypothetical protein
MEMKIFEKTPFLHMKTYKFFAGFSLPTSPPTPPLVMSNA